MDTFDLWVEWLGVERVRVEVVGSSDGGRVARVFRVKNSCDL